LKARPLEIDQQIGRQILWSLKNNEGKIKLALDPPHLGNIYMEINRDKEHIQAVLWTDNLITKEILESHQIQLDKILREDGFKLEKFDVFLHQDMGSLQQQEENLIDAKQQGQGQFEEDELSLPIEELETDPIVMGIFHGGSQYLDLFV
jgi:flagellar hook-length control protein FliK